MAMTFGALLVFRIQGYKNLKAVNFPTVLREAVDSPNTTRLFDFRPLLREPVRLSKC